MKFKYVRIEIILHFFLNWQRDFYGLEFSILNQQNQNSALFITKIINRKTMIIIIELVWFYEYILFGLDNKYTVYKITLEITQLPFEFGYFWGIIGALTFFLSYTKSIRENNFLYCSQIHYCNLQTFLKLTFMRILIFGYGCLTFYNSTYFVVNKDKNAILINHTVSFLNDVHRNNQKQNIGHVTACRTFMTFRFCRVPIALRNLCRSTIRRLNISSHQMPLLLLSIPIESFTWR